MTRTGEEGSFVMTTTRPPPTSLNKQFNILSQFNGLSNSFNNNYRSIINKDRDHENMSCNVLEDGRWSDNKRKDSLDVLKAKLSLHQHPPFPQGFLLTPYCTLPDRYLSRSSLLEVREVPTTLTNGSQWDQLSQTMWNKFLMHRQTEDIYKKKIALWKLLYIHIKSSYPKYGLLLVGSTLTGFGGNNSDVDMCLIVRQSEVDQRRAAVTYLGCIFKLLFKLDFIGKQELIHAKVPILKFQDVKGELEVDLNCNNSVGIRNTHLLYCYSQLDWRVRPLVIVIKLWAHYHDINDAKNMTISSYSLTLMVIHFLQCGVKPAVLPCLHAKYPNKFSNLIEISKIDIHEELDPYHSMNTMSIGELLVKFFDYYANFIYCRYAISVRLGSVISIESCRQVRTTKNDPHQWKHLCIEEPFDLTNTARSVYNLTEFERILRIFRCTASTLKETIPNLDSIFRPLSFGYKYKSLGIGITHT